MEDDSSLVTIPNFERIKWDILNKYNEGAYFLQQVNADTLKGRWPSRWTPHFISSVLSLYLWLEPKTKYTKDKSKYHGLNDLTHYLTHPHELKLEDAVMHFLLMRNLLEDLKITMIEMKQHPDTSYGVQGITTT